MNTEATKQRKAKLARQRQIVKREAVDYIKRHHPSIDLRVIKTEVGKVLYGGSRR